MAEKASKNRSLIAGVLTLEDSLQSLASWILQEEEVTLAEAVSYMGEPEVTVRDRLNKLQQEDLIQIMQVAGETRYRRAHFGSRGSGQISQQIWQSLAPISPLAIIRNPSGPQAIVAGEGFELYVTITNQGDQSAIIEVAIEATETVLQWCLSPRCSLTLGPGQCGEVVFEFQIPAQALPEQYPYRLVVDAPGHYREETPITFDQVIQVQPPVQAVVRVNDPAFVLQPLTSAAKPALLTPGQPLEVLVLVENRSDRVDRFRLTCLDLPPDWFTVRYPEGLNTPGLVVETNSLELNPAAQQPIRLLIHPPTNAAAGIYSPTVRLHSANNPSLVLLDLVYVQVPPNHALTLELRTITGTVQRRPGQFSLRLNNIGNSEREVTLKAFSADEDTLCSYTFDPAPETWLLPSQTLREVNLWVEPTKWWCRPLFGGGRPLNFWVEVDDRQQLPVLPEEKVKGSLLWQARPWWQFWLLVLTTLGALATIVFLIWWMFLRPPAPPKILEFSSNDATYQEASGDFVLLNWKVHHANQIKTIRITSQTPDGSAAGKTITYGFDRGIPPELKPFCNLTSPLRRPRQKVLTCSGVQTDARKAGGYIFEMAITSKRSPDTPIAVQKTDRVNILASQPQQPQIVFFKVDDQDIAVNSKYLVPLKPEDPVRQVLLSWQVKGGKGLKVELTPAPGNVGQEGAIAHVLTPKSATETFVLKVTNAAGVQVSRSVMIEPFLPPEPATPPPPPDGAGMPIVPPPPPLGEPTAAGTPGQPGAGAAASTQTGAAGASPSPNPNAPAPSDPGSLSPQEFPPKFD